MYNATNIIVFYVNTSPAPVLNDNNTINRILKWKDLVVI